MHKVLHMLNFLGNGGSEKYIYSLAKKLHGKSCEFYVAYSIDGPGRCMFEELGISLIPLQMKGPFDIKAASQLKALCSKLSIDTVHTHFLRENYISVISKIMCNNVQIINTRHMLFENSKMIVFFNRLVTRFNYRIIAVSRHVMDRLIVEGVKKKKISMIYNGIDAEEFSSPAKSCMRNEMGISDNEILITSVARFSPEKGHGFVLKAIRYFEQYRHLYGLTGKKCRFVLAGDGPLYGAITEQAKEYGLKDVIRFPGYVDNVSELLKCSDIFIAHSESEALGINILEAMAAGLPVITTDSGGTSEIINDSDKTGILIKYGDIKGFADGIGALAANDQLRKKYAENGIRTVRKRFSLDKNARETYNLYVVNAKSRKGDRHDR